MSEISRMNHFEYMDEDSIDIELKCSICTNPFMDPGTIWSCDHTFCRTCIESMLRNNNKVCPICRDVITFFEFRKATRNLLNMLNRILMRCKYCNEINIERGDIHEHIDKLCPKFIVYCSAGNNQCVWIGSRDKLKDHLSQCTTELKVSFLKHFVTVNNEIKQLQMKKEVIISQRQRLVSAIVLESKRNSLNQRYQNLENDNQKLQLQLSKLNQESELLKEKMTSIKIIKEPLSMSPSLRMININQNSKWITNGRIVAGRYNQGSSSFSLCNPLQRMSLNNSDLDLTLNSPRLLNQIKFGIFLSLQIPSIICSLYLFIQYLSHENLRQSIHNDIIIVLLCSSFLFVLIPLSASEAFFYRSHVQFESDVYCSFWTWIHYSINISNLILMGFACAERHWLIFRLNLMQRRKDQYLYHYIPILICLIYPWLFYLFLIFFYPCQSAYDYNQLLCLAPCYFFNILTGNLDTIINNCIPIFSIPILSGILFVRFLFQKHRVQINLFRWKRDRKMLLQLLSITLLYVFGWAPLQTAAIYINFYLGGISPQFIVDYFYSLPYFIHLFYPFVVLFSNSEFRRRRNHIVQPQKDYRLQTIRERTAK
ncbi:hypothetical protein I4U23_000210 [Adineta vaga]|nr:hypothetical protein I4U23_000210 [Adineta vaga]